MAVLQRTIAEQIGVSPPSWLTTTGLPGTPVIETQPVGVVRVRDSDADAVAGKTFEAKAGSTDLGNNVNWKFLPFKGTIFVVH